ncbi:major histocompatibility complex class I-related gene protein-like [Aulostomus maculatus]
MTPLILLAFHSVAAVTHSLKYFYTASSQVPNFPEFVGVGLVNGVETVRFDSNAQKAEARQDWMERITADVPDYWEGETQGFIGAWQDFTSNIEIAKERFNQTKGVHIYQNIYGCEWDDETGEVTAFDQDGYDGEDFIAFDLQTLTWIAPNQQAFMSKLKWDNDNARITQRKNYFTKICPEWLKKYVNYGRSSLLRTELPKVSLLQKSPSSPVSCFATGFYPNRAAMFWRKDGEELHEDVDLGEILPNHDGTFQMAADLKLPPEDQGKYECVFQLSGVKEVLVTRLEKDAILSNEKPVNTSTIVIIAAVLVLAIAAVVAVVVYRRTPADGPRRAADSDSELSDKLNAEASVTNVPPCTPREDDLPTGTAGDAVTRRSQ